jgi:AcrR family transcriptional regulator
LFKHQLADRVSIMSEDPSLIPLTQAHRRIHAAAMKLFADHGVTKVSISEPAAAAGMARGTIYGHVPDVDRC